MNPTESQDAAMPKKSQTFRLEEKQIELMKKMAKDRHWDMTTIVELGIDHMLKSDGYLDDKGNPTDKATEE